mmetsp:Transcript_105894/g.187244  ORF Transcript_105894/g.187244 Transcript_105894/m.187244 type:complete len:685 (-) Transcript_105894:26-2080(-)
MDVFKPCLLLSTVFLLSAPSTPGRAVGRWPFESLLQPLMRRSEHQSIDLRSAPEGSADHAVVTLVCNDHWVHGALALGASLRAAGTKAETAIMLSHNVSKAYESVLAANFNRVFYQDGLAEHPSIWRTSADCLTMQLNVWRLPYKKVLYMDADMVVLRSPDALFDEFGELAARKERKGPLKDEFNGGMFMCQPKEETFVMLREALKTKEAESKIDFSGMQHFLNLMFPPCGRHQQRSLMEFGRSFPGCWHGQFNSSHNRFTRDLSEEEAAALKRGEIVYDSLHFSGDWESRKKPWMRGCFMGASSTTRHQGQTKTDIMDIWSRAYGKVKFPSNSEHLMKVECPYYSCKIADKGMDFIVQADELDCVTRNALNRALKFGKGRRVLLLTSGENCKRFNMSRVQCLDRDELMPEVSQQTLLKWLAHKFGEGETRTPPSSPKVLTEYDHHDLASLAKKLSMQLARLGIAQAAQKLGLSDTYVILESVMLLIRAFCPFDRTGRTNFMENLDDEKEQCQQKQKVSFERLTGQRYAFSKSGKSFAANHIVVNTKTMNELLEVMKNRSGALHWSAAILESTCASLQTCRCGFSDSGSYASWVHATQPSYFSEMPPRYRDFKPNFTEDDIRLVKASALYPVETRDQSDKCCPSAHDFHNESFLGAGHQFVKFSRECEHLSFNQTDVQRSVSYR